MLKGSTFLTPFAEVKFTGGAETGEFTGYGAVFNTMDSHGDVIRPGAFADTLSERKAAGRTIPMHVMHAFLGGDGLPVGVWKAVAEDSHGLRVTGKISGMNTDAGRMHAERIKDGAYGGMSIGYKVRPNGAVYGKAAGEPKRTLKALDLREISLVTDPSHADARIDGYKAAGDHQVDATAAATSLGHAMRMHDKAMASRYSEASPRDQALLMTHLRDAHTALTGSACPADMQGWTKSIPVTPEEFEAGLKQHFRLTDAQARDVTGMLVKSMPAEPPAQSPPGLSDLGSTISGFKLPTF